MSLKLPLNLVLRPQQVRQAMSAVPEQNEADAKLLVDVERVRPRADADAAGPRKDGDGCSEEDRLMCSIADSL